MNRVQIVNDVFSFSRAGYINLTKQFELYEYLQNENNFLVLKVILNNLKFLFNIFHSTDVLESYKSYLLKFVKPISSQKSESEKKVFKRGIIETIINEENEPIATDESSAENTTSENSIEQYEFFLICK